MTPSDKVENLRQIIVRSALWGWDMHRRGATAEQTERIAAAIRIDAPEPEEGAR